MPAPNIIVKGDSIAIVSMNWMVMTIYYGNLIKEISRFEQVPMEKIYHESITSRQLKKASL